MFLNVMVTLLTISCYLHRSTSHHSVEFVKPITHFFRFITWYSLGVSTKRWAAVHRKHHDTCDTPEDPHSPYNFGLKKILLEGIDICIKAGTDKDILSQYGEESPDDLLEKKFYTRYPQLGLYLGFILQLFMFGIPALIIWPVQTLIPPFIAAGFINGIAHTFGYQRYRNGDKRPEGGVFKNIGYSRNVPTFGLAVGEEFHNNHHAYPYRYKLSQKWWEFDLAGTCIEILCLLRLAKVPTQYK